MLLYCGSGQNEERAVARKRIHLLPVQISKVAVISDAGPHARDSSVDAPPSDETLRIFPGLSSPFGS